MTDRAVIPFHLLRLDHVVLRTNQLQDMLAFYCDVLGCQLEKRQDDLGLVQLRAGSALIDLVPVDSKLGHAGGPAPQRQGHNMDHFCLQLVPFDEDTLRRHLTRHGVQAGETLPRYGAQGTGPSIYVHDPDGNTVELKGGT